MVSSLNNDIENKSINLENQRHRDDDEYLKMCKFIEEIVGTLGTFVRRYCEQQDGDSQIHLKLSSEL